jgi:hypothetical protein
LYQYPATASFLDLPGWEEFEQHGYSVDLTKRKDYGIVLAVSSVGRTSKIEDRTLAYDLHRAGQVNLYSIQTGGKPSATLLSTLKSDRAYAAFGSKIRVGFILITIEQIKLSLIQICYLISFTATLPKSTKISI